MSKSHEKLFWVMDHARNLGIEGVGMSSKLSSQDWTSWACVGVYSDHGLWVMILEE